MCICAGCACALAGYVKCGDATVHAHLFDDYKALVTVGTVESGSKFRRMSNGSMDSFDANWKEG